MNCLEWDWGLLAGVGELEGGELDRLCGVELRFRQPVVG
jgi:hypothetical protein